MRLLMQRWPRPVCTSGISGSVASDAQSNLFSMFSLISVIFAAALFFSLKQNCALLHIYKRLLLILCVEMVFIDLSRGYHAQRNGFWVRWPIVYAAARLIEEEDDKKCVCLTLMCVFILNDAAGISRHAIGYHNPRAYPSNYNSSNWMDYFWYLRGWNAISFLLIPFIDIHHHGICCRSAIRKAT